MRNGRSVIRVREEAKPNAAVDRARNYLNRIIRKKGNSTIVNIKVLTLPTFEPWGLKSKTVTKLQGEATSRNSH